ncbi:hypothetical protein EBB07_29175 [Paenibacillaceae bacterium]|nr:hypothetical protein EBB07_29175 [Paenibacillaceae bacterium]
MSNTNIQATKDFDRIEFFHTPYGSIRSYIYYDEDIDITLQKVTTSKEFQLFQALAIWGGYDKSAYGMYSWELSKTLIPFVKEKYHHRSDVKINF